MTEIAIDAGICGFSTVVAAIAGPHKSYSVRLRSECPLVQQFGEDLPPLSLRDIFQPFLENPVYRVASRVLSHTSCPIPSGVLKALEVEAEMALPRDVHMIFSDPATGGG
jgi:hypothetical protein